MRKGDVLVAAKVRADVPLCVRLPERRGAFKARGASLFLLDLNGGADDVSGNGIARLSLTIIAAFAAFERDRIGEHLGD